MINCLRNIKNTFLYSRILISGMLISLFTFLHPIVFAQQYIISGKVTDARNGQPIESATIHLIGSEVDDLSKQNGQFRLNTKKWYDSLEVTFVGYLRTAVKLDKSSEVPISIVLRTDTGAMDEIVIDVPRKPGRPFMERVIENKEKNNPERFASYSYQRYARNQLDVTGVDFANAKGRGIRSQLLNTYAAIDSTTREDGVLPIYFDESIVNGYHTSTPKFDQENIIAKKNLGLQTDVLLSQFDNFYFYFNVYDDWMYVFSQSFVSPLNPKAFTYYNFYEGDQDIESDDTIQMVRFVPKRQYARAFDGFMEISRKTLAVVNVEMRLNKTVNLNFIDNIIYSGQYDLVYDKELDTMVYMPYKYSSDVRFQRLPELVGIPVSKNKNGKQPLQFIFRNKNVLSGIRINVVGTKEDETIDKKGVKTERQDGWAKPDSFWSANRPVDLTYREQSIYKTFDSLRNNKLFQRDIKLIDMFTMGDWKFGNVLRIGPWSSVWGNDELEGTRFRLGFSTMDGISKKVNVFGHMAYGTNDEKLKGALGANYLWNRSEWTRTTVSYTSDFDFQMDQSGAVDEEHFVNDILRKKHIPFMKVYIREIKGNHIQYINPDLSLVSSLSYKQQTPAFDFSYKMLDPGTHLPTEDVLSDQLYSAEASVGFRYVHNEIFQYQYYDKISLATYHPIITFNYTHGFRLSNAQFQYNKLDLSMQQYLRVPPKSVLFYRVKMGKTFGTVPYLLMDVPKGNEYTVYSETAFNTMLPYEFANDGYISLNTHFSLSGVLMDKIPLIKKLGWREGFIFNALWGCMSEANKTYNSGSSFYIADKRPFMEAGAGIENVFHILSFHYFRRLNYLSHPLVKKGGIYIGISMTF